MPELPEVETVRLGLAKHAVGTRIESVAVLHSRATNTNSIAPISTVKGRRITAIKRRGKFLWLELDSELVLVAHLGMSGQFKFKPAKAPKEAHSRVILNLGSSDLHFIDQRTFGWLSVEEVENGLPSSVQHIAPDPFDPEFKLKSTIENYLSRNTEIKRALLNQEIMSGIGNIYADEALWYARINPMQMCGKLTSTQMKNIITAAKKVMEKSLKAGGTSFDDLYVNVNGESGYYERSLRVYGLEGEPCKRCGKLIRRVSFANRSSHFCPNCQPIPRGKGSQIKGGKRTFR
jgi:formamidopyrimidine-DNA glycosylase